MRFHWILAVLLAAAQPQILIPSDVSWFQPFTPYRVIGNVYYVGTKGLASYLIATPEGNILINTGFEITVPLVEASVKKLGFRFEDTKIVLISHAHNDHAAGLARVRELTGARVMVMRGDDDVIAQGGKGDFAYGSLLRWKACPVDRILHDGDEVKLGGVKLVAHLTPGHTRGCTTWTLVARDGSEKYNVVIVGSPNVNPGYHLVNNSKYPEIAKDYERGFEALKSLPCDVFLGAHGAYYGMLEKYERMVKGEQPNPFIDPAGYRTFVLEKEKEFRKKLAEQGKKGQ